MSNKNLGEQLCEAVDIIAKARVGSVAYDQTIICTITNDTLKDKGQYKVSNGSAEFDAYTSNTEYRSGDNVYVSIPRNDWNEQKFIIGKYTNKDTGEYFVYQNPFNTLVDITGNVINANVPTNESGLVANNPNEEYIILWSYNINNEALRKENGNIFSGYTRLGLQASFQSLINPFSYKEYEKNDDGSLKRDEDGLLIVKNQANSKIIDGEYGLRLRLKVTQNQTLSEVKNDGAANKEVIFYLNTADMNGNPYNFNNFFQQEKVFDVSEYESIHSIQIEFYQIKDSFIDASGYKLPYLDEWGNITAPNLYVKDVYLCLGYDTSEFDEEMIKVYTLDTLTYSRKTEPFMDNAKRIDLRWIHKMPDGSFKSITKADAANYNFKIQWYRYQLGSPSSDQYSDKEWIWLSDQETENGKNYYTIQDEDWLNNNQQYKGSEKYPGFFNTWLIPDVALSTEMVKAIIFFNGKPIRSNIVILTNENEVVSRPTVDALEALTIHCNNGLDEAGNPIYSENYLIYNEGNELIDESQAKQPRQFELKFDPEVPTEDDETEGLKYARYVEWRIPKKNTMIVMPPDYKDNNALEDITDPNYYIIRRNGVLNADNKYVVYNKQSFRIDNYYSAEKSNNTVQCTIEKEPNTFYIATVDLLFGVAGTTGTDTTLVINFDDSSLGAIDSAISGNTIITAKLYDSENKDITQTVINQDCVFEWKWKGKEEYPHEKIQILSPEDYSNELKEQVQKNQCVISNTNNLPLELNEWNILQCTVTGWQDYPLVAYFAIPLKRDPDNAEKRTLFMEGATRIIYDSAGTPSYYKNPYKLFYSEDMTGENQEGEIETINQINQYLEDQDMIKDDYSIRWQLSYHPDFQTLNYLPSIGISKNYNDGFNYNIGLKAINVYVKGCEDYITINCIDKNGTILWSQPLLILQNKYPSSMLNKWDGSLSIDETENAILAAKIAAGSKDSENRFSGVIIGDWGNKKEYKETTNASVAEIGVYGFHEGAMSFGFKESGKAFIGKDTRGRIHFDGNDGSIYSSAWIANSEDNHRGLYLDIDDGNIQMRQEYGSANITTFIQVPVNTINFKSNIYYAFQEYILSKEGYSASKTYYEPYGYKLVDIEAGGYEPGIYYKRIESSSTTGSGDNAENIKITEYVLDNESFNPTKNYYYVSAFKESSVSASSYQINKYYIKQEPNKDEATGQILINSLIPKEQTTYYKPFLTYYEQTEISPNKYIDLATSSNETDYRNVYPLSIGYEKNVYERAFRVSWDGTIYVENGEFNGEIHATSGTLGDLEVTGTLIGGTIVGGDISGAWISGSTIEGSRVYADDLICYNGNIAGWRITENYLRNSNGTIVLYSDGERGELAKFGGWKVTKLGFENRLGTYKDANNIRTTNNFSYLKGGLISGSILDTPSGGMLLAGKFKLAQSLSPGFDTNTGIGNYLLIPGTIGVVMSDIETSPDAPEYYGIGLEYGEPVKSQIKATAVNVGMRYGVNQSIWITDKTIGLASNDGDLSLHSKDTIHEYSATNVNIGVKTGSGNNVELYPQFESYYNGGQQTVTLGIYANDAITIGPVENVGASSCNLIRIGEQSLTMDIGAWTTNLNIGQNAQNIKIGEFAKTIIEIGSSVPEIKLGSTSTPKITIGNTGAAVTIQNNLLTPNLYITNGFEAIDGNYAGTIVMNPSGFQLQGGSFTLGKDGASVSGNIYYNGSINLENGFNVTSGSINIGGGENEAIFGSIYYSGSVNLGNGLQITTGDLNIKGGSATFDNNLEVKGTVTIGSGLTVAEGATVTGVYATLL